MSENYEQKKSDLIPEINSEIRPEVKPERVVYTGLFLDEEAKEQLLSKISPMFEKLFAHHITLRFKPQTGISEIEVGTSREVSIIGEVIDYEIGIQAVLVELEEDLKTDKKYPHITISAKEGVTPVKSNEAIEKAIENSTIKKLENPIRLTLTEGFFNGTTIIKS